MQAFKYEKEVHEGAGKWLFSAVRSTRHKQTNQHENRVMMQEATHLPSDTFHTIPHYSRMITFLFFLAWLCCCQATKGKGIICTQNTNCVYRAWLDIQLLYLETKISRRHHETERENSSDMLAHLFPPNNRGVLSQPLPPHFQAALVVSRHLRANAQTECSSEADNDHLVCFRRHSHTFTVNKICQPAHHQTLTTLIINQYSGECFCHPLA